MSYSERPSNYGYSYWLRSPHHCQTDFTFIAIGLCSDFCVHGLEILDYYMIGENGKLFTDVI